MAVIEVIWARRTGGASRVAPVGGVAFQWIMVALLGLLLGGLFLDGWAHTHNRVDQSFFTPWHAAFYSGYASVGLGLAGALLLNYRRGYLGRQAVPRGYELSLLGVAIFAAAAVLTYGGMGVSASSAAWRRRRARRTSCLRWAWL